jgi:hypothetical protein
LIISYIYIENGYGRAGKNNTDFIIALATSPDLTLGNWRIGSQGYDYAVFADGTNADDLLKYLSI